MNLRFFWLCILWMCAYGLSGTTIIPFENLHKMGLESDAVVFAKCIDNYEIVENGTTHYYSKFRSLQVLSGELEESFAIQHYSYKTKSYTQYILGDVEFKENTSYLLFLSSLSEKVYRPRLYSYAIFQEMFFDKESILVPIDFTEEIHLASFHNDATIEPLYNFKTGLFLNHLSASLHDEVEYDCLKFVHTGGNGTQIRTAPSHCAYLFPDTLPHWPNFPILPLPVWYHEDGVDNCSNIPGMLQNAINEMSSEYPGINLAIAGSHDFVPSCGGGSALDTMYVNWVRNSLGGDRHLVIQFDDPCGEIPSNVLARGGILKLHSTHLEQGKLWRDAAIGSVLMNNGYGYLCGIQYERVLIHEMTHALGFDHIAGSGTANMNAVGIYPIMQKDRDCVNYSYPDIVNDCGSIEIWEDLILYTDMTIRASTRIELSKIDIYNNAVFTLIAPEIEMDEYITVNTTGALNTVLIDACN